MSSVPRLFRRFIPQLLHILVLPLFFFAFVLIYRPFSMHHMVGTEFFAVHVTIISCIIFASAVVMRLLYYYLPLRLNYTLYIFWCLAEIVFMSFFVALYIWLVLDKPMPYFDMMKNSFQYIFLTLIIPYSILALSVRVYDYSNKSAGTDDAARRMRFYDSSHNLKFVINPESVLYIGAEENYIHIYYSDGAKIKSYVLRNSMKAVDELCLSNGLVRCHRSYYVNPSHIKVLRKDREGVVFAILDVDGVIDIPVSRKYYNSLSDLL